MWLWIGDSHLEAMLPRVRDLSAAKGIGGAIYAKSGWSAIRWLRDGDAAGLIARRNPDTVVYVLGTNDDPVSPRSVQGLVAAAGGRPIVWFGPFHNGAKDAALRAVLGTSFVSGAEMAAGLPFRPGGNVHLTADGYRALADRLVDRAQRGSMVAIPPALVVGGTVLIGVMLIALFSDPVYERARWKPGEFNPFNPEDWATRRSGARRGRR